MRSWRRFWPFSSLTQLCGAVFARLRQPRVLGDVTAGLLLGPCALGLLFPGLAGFFHSPAVAPILNALGQIGLVLFMFLIGLEFDFQRLAKILLAVLPPLLWFGWTKYEAWWAEQARQRALLEAKPIKLGRATFPLPWQDTAERP